MKKASIAGRERTTAYIDSKEIKMLKKLAIDRGTSMADLLNQAVRQFLDRNLKSREEGK